jgi:hypothetical protein
MVTLTKASLQKPRVLITKANPNQAKNMERLINKEQKNPLYLCQEF